MATARRRWGPYSLKSMGHALRDIVGPPPADNRQEYLIVFVNCYSRYTILVLANNHTTNTVTEALLRMLCPTSVRLSASCLIAPANLWATSGKADACPGCPAHFDITVSS